MNVFGTKLVPLCLYIIFVRNYMKFIFVPSMMATCFSFVFVV